MTPEEVFAQLRDIHAPPNVARELVAYDVRPVMIFLGVVFAILILRIAWKRVEARRLLSRIDPRAPQADQRDALVRLASARRGGSFDDPAPKAAFQPPGDLTSDGVKGLRHWVLRRIG